MISLSGGNKEKKGNEMKINLKFDPDKRGNMMDIKLYNITDYIGLEDIARDKSKVGLVKSSLTYFVWKFEGVQDETTAKAVFESMIAKGFMNKSDNCYLGRPDRYTALRLFWAGYPSKEARRLRKSDFVKEFFLPKSAVIHE